MWECIKKVERFYYKLDPMPGVLELFKELSKDYRCEILSAIPKPHWGLVGTGEDKRDWVAKYLGKDVPVHIVYDGDGTGVENIVVEDVVGTEKQMIDGQLYVIRNGEAYHITGMRVK
jgi:hypothetical protein